MLACDADFLSRDLGGDMENLVCLPRAEGVSLECGDLESLDSLSRAEGDTPEGDLADDTACPDGDLEILGRLPIGDGDFLADDLAGDLGCVDGDLETSACSFCVDLLDENADCLGSVLTGDLCGVAYGFDGGTINFDSDFDANGDFLVCDLTGDLERLDCAVVGDEMGRDCPRIGDADCVG